MAPWVRSTLTRPYFLSSWEVPSSLVTSFWMSLPMASSLGANTSSPGTPFTCESLIAKCFCCRNSPSTAFRGTEITKSSLEWRRTFGWDHPDFQAFLRFRIQSSGFMWRSSCWTSHQFLGMGMCENGGAFQNGCWCPSAQKTSTLKFRRPSALR